MKISINRISVTSAVAAVSMGLVALAMCDYADLIADWTSRGWQQATLITLGIAIAATAGVIASSRFNHKNRGTT